MSRRRSFKPRELAPDDLYKRQDITKFINYIMWDGKKSIAQSIVYGALSRVATKVEQSQVQVFEKVMENVGPLIEVKSRRLGGATYQVPSEVKPRRRLSLAMRWLRSAARNAKGRSMEERLADEMLMAYNGQGKAVETRNNVMKMAESNRAFSHLAIRSSSSAAA